MDDTREQILTTCRALFAPGQVTELRILGLGGRDKHKAAGWFDDWHALAAAAAAYEARRPQGIYVTLNPLHPACLARTNNRVKDAPEVTTPDRDVARRHWLPIDIDPERPAGVSSTDAEVEASRQLALGIATWLETELGWPPGIRAHSGNGVHLLYRLDLPNDKPSAELVTACLVALKGRYGGDGLKLDLANANASRIWKLYGTVARKGEHTADRPHRRARLWLTSGVYPTFDGLGLVTPAQLEQLAAVGRPAAAPAESPRRPGARKKASKRGREKVATDTEAYFDLEGWIRDNGLAVVRDEPWDDTGRRYILDHCLFDPSHTNTSAALGRARDGHIFYRCMHDACANRGWKDAKTLFAPAGQHRRKEVVTDGDLPDDPWQLARRLLDEELTDPDTGQVLARCHREVFYQYDQRRHAYKPLSNDSLRVLVTRWLGERIEKTTRTKVKDVVDCVTAIVTVPAEIEIPFVSKVDADSGCASGDPLRCNRIALRNGILDIDRIVAGEPFEACLLPHTPEWFDVSALPFNFPTNAEQLETPVWSRFLADIFQGDESRISLLQEAFGYCFFQDTCLETFFVFHGRGRNGKSTVLAVLRAMLGENNVCSLTPEQFADRFLVYALWGKLANLCADMSEMDSVQEGVLKALVTGDLITTDRKYRESVQFRSRAKVFLATNTLPRFTDTTLGTWRRMVLIPFEYVCPLDKVDPHLFRKLEGEMPGIFLWALVGMLRLHTNRRFGASERCETAAREYRLACFPILMFLEECTVSKGDTEAGDLWDAYRRWGEACGLRKPKPLHSFVKDVLGFQPHIQYVRKRKQMEARLLLHGIGLVENLDGQLQSRTSFGAVNAPVPNLWH